MQQLTQPNSTSVIQVEATEELETGRCFSLQIMEIPLLIMKYILQLFCMNWNVSVK